MNASFQYHYQPLQAGPASPSGVKTPTQRIPEDAFPPPDLDVFHSNVRELKPERKSSMPVVVGSLIGTILPMIVMASREGLFKKAKGLGKLFAPFNVDYKSKNGYLKIIALGGSAVLGGFLGGVINDKGEDTWAKIKEGNYQFITNIVMPVLFCKFFDGIAEKLAHKFPKIDLLSSEKNFPKITRAAIIGLVGVVTGVTTGAFLSNQLNKRIHKDDIPPRKIHAKDFLIQVDDMAAAFTVTGALPFVDKVLPLVYFLSGMETGNEDGSEKAKEHRPNPA